MRREPIVETSSGKLRGIVDRGLCVFRGLRFARPPLGALRFRVPVKPEPWSGVRDATHFAPAAPQLADDPFVQALVGTDFVWDEDCLALNVWTPGLDNARRPVLVFIHGGAFLRGATSWPAYDGAELARRGEVVVVTLQYRLAALGFLYLAGLGADPEQWPSNLGLRDQIAALEWVRDEIAAFGGNPNNVTVFGHSAGSVSLGVLLTVPRARRLFRRAILQSGPPVAIEPAQAAPVAETLLRTLGVRLTELDRLREIPVASILAANQQCEESPGRRTLNLPFLPVRDGDLVPADPIAAIRDGAARDIDVIVGCTRDEMTLFLALDPGLILLDEAALQQRVTELIAQQAPSANSHGGSAAQSLIDRYRQSRRARGERTEPWAIWCAIKGDGIVRHASMRLAELQRINGAAAYTYLFAWASPFMDGVLGACHTLDLPFLFGTLDHPRSIAFTGNGPEAARLAMHMQDAWIAFARSGDPSHAGIGTWPAYDVCRRQTMIFAGTCGIEAAPLEDQRGAWDELLPG